MYKVWSIEDVRKVLNDTAEKLKFPCDNIPIEISKRMTKCKGKFAFIQKENKFIPKYFRFSAILLSGIYKECDVRETIIHEYIHYYCIIKDQYKHGHDKYFKTMCKKVGISDNTYFSAKPHKCAIDIEKINYKYEIICSKCLKIVAKRQRKTGIDKLLKKYKSKCCNAKLKCNEINYKSL